MHYNKLPRRIHVCVSLICTLPELRTREERSNQYFGTDLMPVDSQAVDDLDEIYERVSVHPWINFM